MLKLLLILAAFSSGVLCNKTRVMYDDIPSVNPVNCYPWTGSPCLPKIQRNPAKPTTAPTTGCVNGVERSDYEVTEGMGAHKLHKRKVKWDKARKSCMAEGGVLAIINSSEEEAMLLNWMQRENVDFAWLGVHDKFEEGDWVTLTGEPIEAAGYARWTTQWPDKPDDVDGSKNCGVLVKEGGLSDSRCNLRHPYFCKIYICPPTGGNILKLDNVLNPETVA